MPHPARDNTVVDAVCLMHIDPATAPAQSRHRGRTYYFCTRDCRDWFEADPDRYVAYLSGVEARDAFTRHHGGGPQRTS